jgi:hypothetical protein
MRRLKGGYRKSVTLEIKLLRSGVASLENSCDNPDIKNEPCCHPYVKNSPINIRDSFTEVEQKPQKHSQTRGKKSIKLILTVCTSTAVSTSSSL